MDLHQNLKNTGQNNFAVLTGTAGEDLNVETVTDGGTTGQGILVAVIDDGLEIAHEDLVDNICLLYTSPSPRDR